MPKTNLNGVDLHYRLTGKGDMPLVLVHGSWDTLHDWDLAAPGLAEHFRVLAYDRRGHGESERPTVQGSVSEDIADLAALIEQVFGEPAWVVGNSFGAVITLRLGAARPDLVRGLIGHEPPAVSMLAGDAALAPMLSEVLAGLRAVADRIAAGDAAGGAEQFIETVALGPGSWAQLPPEVQASLVDHAATFLDEVNDPEAYVFEPAGLARLERPVLLTKGDESPPMFEPIVQRITAALPFIQTLTFEGAGHIPHVTHPDDYVRVTRDFIFSGTN